MLFWITRFIAGFLIIVSIVMLLAAYIGTDVFVPREVTASVTLAVLAVAALLFDRR